MSTRSIFHVILNAPEIWKPKKNEEIKQ